MGRMITLKSRFDGFELAAYHAPAHDARRGGLVLAQEIFGLTDHIKDLCDGFAHEGYEVIAPSYFDRLQPGFAVGYEGADRARGIELSQTTPWDQVAGDTQAAIDALKTPVFITGFCWGGTVAWLAACRCDGLAAASSFYGRRISELLDETPKVPIILHFGRTDASIPMANVEAIAAAHPDIPFHVYDAGHGFFSQGREAHSPDAARLSRLRTLQVFTRNASAGGGEV